MTGISSHDLAAIAAELSDVALIMCDQDLIITYVNPAAENLLERSKKRLVGTRLGDLAHWGAEAEKVARLAVKQDRSVLSRDITLPGSSHPYPGRIQAVPENAMIGLTLSLHAPPSKSSQMDPAASAAVGFGRLLSHELKNPIAGARGAAQLLAQDHDGEIRELSQLIMTELDRAGRIADHWSRVGDIVAQPFASININEMAREALQSAEAASKTDIDFQESFDPSLPDTGGDRDLLLQAILNLITNAVEAVSGMAEARIRIVTRYRQPSPSAVVPEARLTLEIQDNGPGVPDAIRSSLFNPFVTSKDAGEGLGLAFVSRVADLHDGAVEFDSQPGRTLFRLHLRQEQNPS